jgi:predicted dehydrogenase
MQPEPIRVGVVGYGYWGVRHVRVLTGIKNVHVTVIDTEAQRLAEARDRYPQIPCVDCIENALENIDCVVVATPPAQHAPVAIKALASGRHALIEKPFTTSVQQAEELVAVADANDVKLMAAHTYIYHHALQILKAMIGAGEIGDILYVDSARLALGRYRPDVNVIWDLAPHDISILSYLLGQSPHSVTAWGHSSGGYCESDLAYLRLEFGTTVAFINLSWISPRKIRQMTIVGNRKMAVYDGRSAEPLRIYDSRVDLGPLRSYKRHDDSKVAYHIGTVTSPYVPYNEPLVAQDVHFIECVRKDFLPQTTGYDGLQNVRVLAALDRSRQSGERVKLVKATEAL